MDDLAELLTQNEEWLMGRILDYSIKRGYSAYTSTLREPWRLSISGLSGSILQAIRTTEGVPEMGPEDDFLSDPIAQFGIVEAQRHRERGVALGMFLGLMKYYRQTYLDLIQTRAYPQGKKDFYGLFLNRVFDRIEIGFCVEWSGGDDNRAIHELQISNRLMTNEKNKYLTIFESIPNPIIILNAAQKVDNMNLAAARLFRTGTGSGSQYYCLARDRQMENEILSQANEGEPIDRSCFSGCQVSAILPWMDSEVARFFQLGLSEQEFEKAVELTGKQTVFRVKLTKSLDVRENFQNLIIILEDITSLKEALAEIRTLKGFIPICAWCKNIRDDQGYWQKVEQYVQEHSEAKFSHGICPDCARKLHLGLSSQHPGPDLSKERNLGPKG